MTIVRKRNGDVWFDGRATGITVTFDSGERVWSAYGAGGEWLFDGRTQWHVMNALGRIAEAIAK